MQKIRAISAFTVILLALSACEPNTVTRGHLNYDQVIEGIQPNYTTREALLESMGSPSAQSTFGEETWYYITTKRESYAFLAPEIAERDIIAVQFDETGTVSAVNRYTGEEARDIEIASRKTPTEGHELTFGEQLLGNIGRFNNPGGGRAKANRRPSNTGSPF